jgi:hypothetical protein
MDKLETNENVSWRRKRVSREDRIETKMKLLSILVHIIFTFKPGKCFPNLNRNTEKKALHPQTKNELKHMSLTRQN